MTDDNQKKDDLFVHYDSNKGTVQIKAEKRVLARIPVDRVVVVLEHDNDRSYSGKLLNLSGSGALIEVPLALKMHQLIELSVDEATPSFARAVVARVAKEGTCYGIKWLEIMEQHLPKGMLTKIVT